MTISGKIILAALSAAFLLSACQSGSTGQPGSESYTVQLQCQTGSTDPTAPQSAVYAIVNQNKVKLAGISRCDSIPPASYEDHDIPEGALAAVGGWWAGAGDFFYAIREDSAISFYQGWAEEGEEEDIYHYRNVGAFADGRFSLMPPTRKEELVGTYALSQESGSHILFVGLKEDSLRAEYFITDGILPPVNQLNILMTSMEPEAVTAIGLNPITLHFDSALGKGRFLPEEKGAAVLLQDKQVQGRALKMEKILSKDYSLPVQ